LKIAENILIPLGEYFPHQDDYLDCFAPPELLGKIGTDILDNKNGTTGIEDPLWPGVRDAVA